MPNKIGKCYFEYRHNKGRTANNLLSTPEYEPVSPAQFNTMLSLVESQPSFDVAYCVIQLTYCDLGSAKRLRSRAFR